MTAAEERKLVLEMLTKLQKSVDGIQKSMKSGGEAMKGITRELNSLKKLQLDNDSKFPEPPVEDGPFSAVDAFEDDEDDYEEPAAPIARRRSAKELDLSPKKNLFDPNDYLRAGEEEKGYDDIDDSVVKPRASKSRRGFKKKKAFCEDCKKTVELHPSVHLSTVEGSNRKVYSCPESKMGTCQNQ